MGAWVKTSGVYKSDKRHYYPDASFTFYDKGDDYRGFPHGVQKMDNPALCGALVSNSYYYLSSGTMQGGLSIKYKVDIMQRNLCAYCVKKYMKANHPQLLEDIKDALA